ncbi:RecB family exonuclease [Saccharomonospora glauca]|jgi:RecB family exonuclease|uniref:ATP-dependent exonuclase V beta subunit, helicase and exonuclease domain-containing n=1 Tax=Saccharomonospora glauca K62 TaxID=928724 RepID=I1CYA4_9PSEU|nr:PD-(D/E)XK nuclease family protein [Saccharomonospora glauca]EIE97678.1 ATP-dependent exonuclase V beta subunit, helicase and exonuclease domain-containing [Saccharomonospora glauca K62]
MEQLGFDFGVEPRPLIRVTPAKLALYDDCPRRYRMTYLDRPTPTRTGPWAHNTMGAVVHNALRELFDLPAAERTPERAASLVGKHWRSAGFADSVQVARYSEAARRWVADYVEAGGADVDVVAVERWVSATTGSDPAAPSLIVEGRIDRVDRRDAELVVVDYKTGRRPPENTDAQRSRALALYAVAARRTLRAPCSRVELHHLPTGTVAAAEHTAETLREHVREAEEIATASHTATDRLRQGGDPDRLFPARPAPRCAWCELRPSCPEGREAAPSARPWDLLAPMA